jgi:hypothetical protein
VSGRLFGVGLGPGDPELVTVKAARLIAAADVVAYHAARHGRSNARAIADPYLRPDQIEEALIYPVTTETTDHPRGWPLIWTPGGTSWSWPRVIRSSTGPTCTCTSGWRTGTRPRWYRG